VLKTECLACDNASKTYESFTDLSLDFPQQYHATNDDMSSACTDACNLAGRSTLVALQADGILGFSCVNSPIIYAVHHFQYLLTFHKLSEMCWLWLTDARFKIRVVIAVDRRSTGIQFEY